MTTGKGNKNHDSDIAALSVLLAYISEEASRCGLPDVARLAGAAALAAAGKAKTQ